MATPNQIAANRENSQKSTGPKTAEGKAASSLNRLSHGFASHATIIPGENPEEFKALVTGLMSEHQPATDTEQILVEKMALNQWLSLRAFSLQGKVFLVQTFGGDKYGIPKDLGLLIRYQTSAERAFHRAHTDLVKTQKERKKSEIGFEPQNTSAAADPPPAQPKPQPKPVNITWIEPDIAADRAALIAQAAKADFELCPEAAEFIKNLA